MAMIDCGRAEMQVNNETPLGCLKPNISQYNSPEKRGGSGIDEKMNDKVAAEIFWEASPLPNQGLSRPLYLQEFYAWPYIYSDFQVVHQPQPYGFENQFYQINRDHGFPIENRVQYLPFKMIPQGHPHDAQLQEFQYFVVIDFEATCDKVNNPFPQEIIEFPSVLVNSATGQLEASFQTYVRPTYHQFLTDFCKELTGIQQIQVDRGVPLSEALLMHDKWLEDKGIKNKNFAIVTWSNWDCRVMLESECTFKRIRKPPYFNRHSSSFPNLLVILASQSNFLYFQHLSISLTFLCTHLFHPSSIPEPTPRTTSKLGRREALEASPYLSPQSTRAKKGEAPAKLGSGGDSAAPLPLRARPGPAKGGERGDRRAAVYRLGRSLSIPRVSLSSSSMAVFRVFFRSVSGGGDVGFGVGGYGVLCSPGFPVDGGVKLFCLLFLSGDVDGGFGAAATDFLNFSGIGSVSLCVARCCGIVVFCGVAGGDRGLFFFFSVVDLGLLLLNAFGCRGAFSDLHVVRVESGHWLVRQAGSPASSSVLTTRRWINLKVPFHEVFGNVRCNLKEAVQLSGLTWEGRAHCGLDDARNTARLLTLLMHRGFKFSITNSLVWQPGLQSTTSCKLSPDRSPDPTQSQQKPNEMSGSPVQLNPYAATVVKDRPMYCYCGVLSRWSVVRKPGPMQGRYFYGCGNWTATRRAICPYFAWAS